MSSKASKTTTKSSTKKTEKKEEKKATAPAASAPMSAAAAAALAGAKPSKGSDTVNAKLALVMKSGKVALGYKSTLKALRSGKAKAILVANNCPPLRRSEIEYFAMLTKTILHQYAGSNNDLGTACGKFFTVSVMSVAESGDSDLLTFLESNQ